ncbi:hypothetical protein D3C73_1172690 [compost metagenome]
MRGNSFLGDNGIDLLQHFLGDVRSASGHQLVQNDAQGIEIAAVINVAVHPSGLFRRNILDTALQHPAVLELPFLTRKLHRQIEIDQLHHVPLPVPDDVRRLNILMNDVLFMHRPENINDLDCQIQQCLRIRRILFHDLFERLPADILQHHYIVTVRFFELIGLDYTLDCCAELFQQPVFLFETQHCFRAGKFGLQHFENNCAVR